MKVVLALFGFLLLCAGGLNGLLAPIVDTCTQNSPDSLFGGVFTIGANILGFVLLACSASPRVLLGLSVLPGLAALSYTRFALWFADGYWQRGLSACSAITGDQTWELSGEEPFLTSLWLIAALTFWAGLGLALFYARRRATKETSRDRYT